MELDAAIEPADGVERIGTDREVAAVENRAEAEARGGPARESAAPPGRRRGE